MLFYREVFPMSYQFACYAEFAFWSSVEGRGLHVEGEDNMSRVQKK